MELKPHAYFLGVWYCCWQISMFEMQRWIRVRNHLPDAIFMQESPPPELSFSLNKIIGWLLVALLLFLVSYKMAIGLVIISFCITTAWSAIAPDSMALWKFATRVVWPLCGITVYSLVRIMA